MSEEFNVPTITDRADRNEARPFEKMTGAANRGGSNVTR